MSHDNTRNIKIYQENSDRAITTTKLTAKDIMILALYYNLKLNYIHFMAKSILLID